MGYTHYWKVADGKKINEKDLKKAIKAMGKVVKDQSKILAGYDGTGEPVVSDTMIRFNGKDEDSHETFAVDFIWPGTFEFCKTARNPYDIVVVACLAIMKHYLGDSVKISSDGDDEDLAPGILLAKKYEPKIDTDVDKLLS